MVGPADTSLASAPRLDHGQEGQKDSPESPARPWRCCCRPAGRVKAAAAYKGLFHIHRDGAPNCLPGG